MCPCPSVGGALLKLFVSGNLKSQCVLVGLGSEDLGGPTLLAGVLCLETLTQALVGISTALLEH